MKNKRKEPTGTGTGPATTGANKGTTTIGGKKERGEPTTTKQKLNGGVVIGRISGASPAKAKKKRIFGGAKSITVNSHGNQPT